ncbi:MAG: hypothetical protein AB7G75_02740 [Candidatus Binatia bacterium]
MRHRITQQSTDQPVTAEQASERQLEADISVHIFSVSAALVGVCLTVIGVIRVVINTSKVDTLVDDFLAADAVLFLTSCLLSYWALRTRSLRRMYRVERIADTIFLVGLFLMVLICSFIVYAIV